MSSVTVSLPYLLVPFVLTSPLPWAACYSSTLLCSSNCSISHLSWRNVCPYGPYKSPFPWSLFPIPLQSLASIQKHSHVLISSSSVDLLWWCSIRSDDRYPSDNSLITPRTLVCKWLLFFNTICDINYDTWSLFYQQAFIVYLVTTVCLPPACGQM